MLFIPEHRPKENKLTNLSSNNRIRRYFSALHPSRPHSQIAITNPTPTHPPIPRTIGICSADYQLRVDSTLFTFLTARRVEFKCAALLLNYRGVSEWVGALPPPATDNNVFHIVDSQ